MSVQTGKHSCFEHACVLFVIVKLINNSSSLNKGNHDRKSAWISDLN